LVDEAYNKYCAKLDAYDSVEALHPRLELRGFQRIHQKQSNIFLLECIVLAGTAISHLNSANIKQKFTRCKELDLSKTEVKSWEKLIEILEVFPALHTLILNLNQMDPLEEFIKNHINLDSCIRSLPKITHLSMNFSSLEEHNANYLTALFVHLEELQLAKNLLLHFHPLGECIHLRVLDLQCNHFPDLTNISRLFTLPSLESLNISNCGLKSINITPHSYSCSANDEIISIFPKLNTLILQDNPISDWSAIDQLAHLPSLRKLFLRGLPLPGAMGVDSREIIIAKIPGLTNLDKCIVSPAERCSAERLFLSRFRHSTPPEHRQTVERLLAAEPPDSSGVNPNGEDEFTAKFSQSGIINSRRIRLQYSNTAVERNLSLVLPIHKVVGLAARLLKFDPEELNCVELRRTLEGQDCRPEQLSRTKDNLLRQFDLEDGDTIVFV